MRTESISQKTARRLTLQAQLLYGRTRTVQGHAGAARVIGHLGYVQIDTISVIERAHHHTLWTRLPGYKPKHLHQALAVERSVFEYWGHAASYLPMADYRFYLPMMHSFLDAKNAWFRNWGEKYSAHLEPVLKRIREEGPKAARDFESPSPQGQGPWWDWKPAKAALETLFWRGELMVRERRGFERVYDLRERVLPAGTDMRLPGPGELGRFIVNRALSALGVASEKEIREYIRIGDRAIIATALAEMAMAGEITTVAIAGQLGAFYALPAVLGKASRGRALSPRVRLLSPFDNLVISRSRLKQRFDFDYTLECYVPQGKRSHGYFVLPILFGEDIVGRLDPKAERKSGTFIVRRLEIDPKSRNREGLVSELGRALCDLARFNGCRTARLENVRPQTFAAPLARALRSLA